MKKLYTTLVITAITAVSYQANAQINVGSVLTKASEVVSGSDIDLSNADIAAGLREALDKGIDEQVEKLTAENGFYKNELVKIVVPEELQKVDKALRAAGFGDLADKGILAMNRAAEDAVKEATPIFVNAVSEITFDDAKNILMGADDAATTYLQGKTTTPLYEKFSPVIETSFSKVGADKIWEAIITKYNKLPFTKDVNPDITDYVTLKALDGVFTMIAVEEKEIRTDISSRTTDLLQQVFGAQD
ncbi:Protein of unknown function [Pustulibacterium marinum]|uniref:DUF4197 domain-containing protein n=1 Tax=Pustulibacterium marinum TaxID=1224947 RepID=A0A1I7FAV9_9FLAO|nr:DUF4197 domain-containing protein [Pustulibacterium marinum]SFU33281.1 Protein of unknown function [Pustulibacterium marinum]